MKKIVVLLIVLMFVFVSCETTSTYVKETEETYTSDEADLFSEEENSNKKEKIETLKKITQGVKEEKKEAVKLDSDTVAVIGKYVLTKEKYKIILEYMRERYGYKDKLTAQEEKEFIEFIVNKKLMSLEARSKGYGDRKDVKIKYEWDFDDIISHDYYEDNVSKKSLTSVSLAKKYYNKHKEDFIEVKAKHIRVKSKTMAKNLYRRLVSGEDFDELAKKYSEDETTKSNGGNMGYFTKGVMLREFEDAAFLLSLGEISEPVKTIQGYHIIKITDKRKISFDDSKDKIVKMVENKKKKVVFDRLMGELKGKYNVIINENISK